MTPPETTMLERAQAFVAKRSHNFASHGTNAVSFILSREDVSLWLAEFAEAETALREWRPLPAPP